LIEENIVLQNVPRVEQLNLPRLVI